MDLDFGFTDLLDTSKQSGTVVGKNVECPNALSLNESDFYLDNQFYGTSDGFGVSIHNFVIVLNVFNKLKTYRH